MTPGTATTTEFRHAAAWLVVIVLALTALCAPGSALAANANFKGTWQPNTGGGWTITSQDAGGTCTGTTVFESSGYTFSNCHVSGTEYKFDVDYPAIDYESHNHGTITGNKVVGEFNDTNGTDQPYTAVRTAGGTDISGLILTQKREPAAGVPVTLTGTSDAAEAVSQKTATDSTGAYGFEAPPGNYSVTASGDPVKQYGGELSTAFKAGVPACSGTVKEATCKLNHLSSGEEVEASFTYTQCAAKARLTEGKEPTGCPIIFIPGILGSRVVCSTGEIYPNLPNTKFSEMELNPDGETDKGPTGSCEAEAHAPTGEAGLFTSSYLAGDVYEGVFNYLKRIATNGAYVYPYDWRRGVPVAAEGLRGLVTEVLTQTDAKHVVLVAHSMGGLVTQEYIADGGAENVSRAVTIGTPYWGAPKSMIALMKGYSNEFSLEPADLLFKPTALQKAVRNYTGLFWLYPSAAYGPWLQIKGTAYPEAQLGGNQIDPWVSSLGGNTALLDRAEAGHAKLDGFKPEGVDYQIVVGTGVPTITHMRIGVSEFESEQWIGATYEAGDGTVPALSQTQGASASGNSVVPIHYVCGIKHADEPGNFGVQSRIEEFVLSGGTIPDPPEPCTNSGVEFLVYQTSIFGHGSAATVKPSAGGALTVTQAIAKGLVQVFEVGGRTIIVTNKREPVTLSLSGKKLAVRVRTLDNGKEGAPVYYGPLSGALTMAPSGSLARGSKKIRPVHVAGKPRVTARIIRRGRRYLVRLTARGPVAGIYTRIGKAAKHRYSKPLLLSAGQLKQLRFAGVSVFGVWQSPQRARAPH